MRILITLLLSYVFLSFPQLQAQDTAGGAPAVTILNKAPVKVNRVIKSAENFSTSSEFVYSTTTYTFGDIVIFSYYDNSVFSVFDTSGVMIDSLILDTDEYYVFNLAAGVYHIEGNKSFTLLTGDPVTNGVLGYFAVDESGKPLSTRINTYMPSYNYSGEHFIIFAYNENTEFTIKNLSNGATISAGILNTGEHYQLDGYNSTFIGVYANKPVSALSYTDQGYSVPAANGTFAGKKFYGFSGYVGGWGNGVIVTGYNDSTNYIIKNSITGDTLQSGVISAGETAVYAVYEELYWEVTTDKSVTVCNQPYASFAGSYYYLMRQIDESGSGIGTNFYCPVIPGDMDIFSFEDDNNIVITDLSNNSEIFNGTLNEGDSYHFYSVKTIYHIEASKNLSVLSSWGAGWGADFMPLNYSLGLPDLTVSSDDIMFDPNTDDRNPGDNIKLSATIHNYGYEDAANVTVQFFDGDPAAGLSISPILTVNSLNAGASASVDYDWIVPDNPKYHEVYVVVDVNNTIVESNESNNTAYKFIISNDDLNPPLAVSVRAPSMVEDFGDSLSFNTFEITANVFNTGDTTAVNSFVKLVLPEGLRLDNPADSLYNFGNIEANQNKSFTWLVHIDALTDGDAFFYQIIVDADNSPGKIVERMLLIRRPTAIDEQENASIVSRKYILISNYPNPFNPSTTVEYSLPKTGSVLIDVFDVSGRKVKRLFSGKQSAGTHTIRFDASDLVSGVYFVRVRNEELNAVRKILLTR